MSLTAPKDLFETLREEIEATGPALVLLLSLIKEVLVQVTWHDLRFWYLYWNQFTGTDINHILRYASYFLLLSIFHAADLLKTFPAELGNKPHIFQGHNREEVERERFFTSLLNKMREPVAAIFLCPLVCCNEANSHSTLS